MYSNATTVHFIRQTQNEITPIQQQDNHRNTDSTAAAAASRRSIEQNESANYPLDQLKVLCSISSTKPPCNVENIIPKNNNKIASSFNLHKENSKCRNNNSNCGALASADVVSNAYTKGASTLKEINSVANKQINDNSHQLRRTLLAIN